MEHSVVGIIRLVETEEGFTREKYIALVQGNPQRWYVSVTLFGLQKQMNSVSIIDWERAERDLSTTTYHKLPKSVHPLDNELSLSADSIRQREA